MASLSRAPLLACTMLLIGCAAGPDYVAPTPGAATAGGYLDAPPSSDPIAAPTPTWWRLYKDPVLDQLIADAFEANTDLRIATANLRRSRALLSEGRSARLPSTMLRAQATDAQSSPDAAALAADAEPNAYEAWATINYEVDLVGRLTRGVQAARADAQAQEAARDLVRITVAADVASAYADVCSLAGQLRAAERAAAVQLRTSDIAQRRLEAGDASGLEAAQARAELERTRSTTPLLRAERRIALYRLAVLTGRSPADYPRAAESCMDSPRLTGPLPVGDAGGLLRRRPDVRQSERKLAAATARVGVAIADLYPRLSFGLSAGVTAEENGDAVTRLQATPLITWTFPNIAGARARIAQARAGADVALAEWDAAVLRSLREVESALVQYNAERERHASLTVLRERSAFAADRARMRREAGEDSPLVQLDAERRLAEAEALLAQSSRALATDEVTLFLALGGGWEGN